MDLALNNLQRLICHKTQPTNQPTNLMLKSVPAQSARDLEYTDYVSAGGKRGLMPYS